MAEKTLQELVAMGLQQEDVDALAEVFAAEWRDVTLADGTELTVLVQGRDVNEGVVRIGRFVRQIRQALASSDSFKAEVRGGKPDVVIRKESIGEQPGGATGPTVSVRPKGRGHGRRAEGASRAIAAGAGGPDLSALEQLTEPGS